MWRGNLLFYIILAAVFSCTANESSAAIKKSNLAGKWYSSNAAVLSGEIDSLLESATAQTGCSEPLALILPHAGYQYSGSTAAAGYRRIGRPGKSIINPNLIIIMGPSHYKSFRGCALITSDYFETPLGRIKTEVDFARRLLAERLFKADDSAFEREHSIEMHLPFLQRIFRERLSNEIRILPVLVGELKDDEARTVAAKIQAAVSGVRALFIISSDFTHYGPNFGYVPFSYSGESTALKIKELDLGAIRYILKKDLGGFSGYAEETGITVCGKNPIKIALALSIDHYKAETVSYASSGKITGDYANSVSYASILFCGSAKTAGPEKGRGILARADRLFLIKSARENINSWLEKKRGLEIPPGTVPPGCMTKYGAFVTLKSRGNLRGCIGYVTAEKPLIQAVLECSYRAAFGDPRFLSVRKEEMKDITIEISVLSEPVQVRNAEEVETGRHGLIIERGNRRGLLLPQVAAEQGWDRYTFLQHTCLKAGLPVDSWRDTNTGIYRFEAIVFDEESLR